MEILKMSRRAALKLFLVSSVGITSTMLTSRQSLPENEIPLVEQNLEAILEFLISHQHSYDYQDIHVRVNGAEMTIFKDQDDPFYELVIPYLVPYQSHITNQTKTRRSTYANLDSAIRHGYYSLKYNEIQIYSLETTIKQDISTHELTNNGEYLLDSVKYTYIGDPETDANKLDSLDNLSIYMLYSMNVRSQATNKPEFGFPFNQANVKIGYFSEDDYLGGLGINIDNIEPAIVEGNNAESHDWMSLLSYDVRRIVDIRAAELTSEFEKLNLKRG